MDLSVIAPCLDEEGNIDELVARTLRTFEEHAVRGEIVLVDDGSTDRTWNQIGSHTRRDSRVRGVRHATNQGIVAGWRTGLSASSGRLVCLIDSDLQNKPEDVARLYAAHRHTHDLVQGVRKPSRGVRRLLLFSRALNVLLNAAFVMRLRDSKSGFVLCRREVLAAILTHTHSYRYYQCFVGISAATHGCRIVEVDTTFEDRRAGESFLGRVPIGVSLRIIWEICKFRIETWALAPELRRVAVPEFERSESVKP